MRVISQLKKNEYGKPAFFVGLSVDEYFEQIKPLFDGMDKRRGRDMFDVEDRIELIEYQKNDDRHLEEHKRWVTDIYGCSDADDLYAVIDKDLKNGFIAERSYPVAGMQIDPWEKYPETIINNIEEIKGLPLIDWETI